MLVPSQASQLMVMNAIGRSWHSKLIMSCFEMSTSPTALDSLILGFVPLTSRLPACRPILSPDRTTHDRLIAGSSFDLDLLPQAGRECGPRIGYTACSSTERGTTIKLGFCLLVAALVMKLDGGHCLTNAVAHFVPNSQRAFKALIP